ncbi:aminotransferase class I/II-fold pyridoxal phosphate-dependent enzyme [candidate division NPL-UPA2 bacterium Unc8]|uniref:Aminotransferase n=1 Tax=candidate division NPL-UPA2 bacterium Unc8 TaxID=1980939 RepID=A0A399FX23_UNCN2|nr:LL-diaminopimelate aminotransferase [Bacillota bacterium]MBT9146605.1 LL-diaminopimelate aminotransferase [Bacillota bacterium]RII00774.1 MAG: aminotransferase class I/II-fold pyridoxal phosphate-dependent enzyme [candidate division NPL-UPA2 bacterium Unc8]
MPEVAVSRRLAQLPTYLFAKIDELKKDVLASGADIIDLGTGDPDTPTAPRVIEQLYTSAKIEENHRYPSYSGLRILRETVARWFEGRFSVKLNPENEILPLLGSKEGIGHIPLAFVNEGDVALVPDPGYPVYQAGTILAGGKPSFLPLYKDNEFLPQLNSVSEDIARRAKIMFINYPNNPTTATASKEFFKEVVRFAKKYEIVVCHDAAYSEVTFGDYQAPSFLEVGGAMDVGVEFHSLSKTYNMTGWRVAWACGNPQIISALLKVKTNLDSGMFQPIQYAAIEALNNSDEEVSRVAKIYMERRDALIDGLTKIGWKVPRPKATLYVWLPLPSSFTSSFELTEYLLREAHIVTTPGVGFGACGEGFIRIALTVPRERIEEAVGRISHLKLTYH